VEQRLEGHDFLAMRLEFRSLGPHFLEGFLEGNVDEWEFMRMPAEEADCVLVVLGLLHMRVKCVIPEELGGDYQPARVRGVCCRRFLTVRTYVPGALVGHR